MSVVKPSHGYYFIGILIEMCGFWCFYEVFFCVHGTVARGNIENDPRYIDCLYDFAALEEKLW